MTVIMTRCYDSIQATIILLHSTALLVPTLFWPYILYFQASYKASGSINIACISHLDSFDRITHSLLLTRLVSLLQVTSPPPALVTVFAFRFCVLDLRCLGKEFPTPIEGSHHLYTLARCKYVGSLEI